MSFDVIVVGGGVMGACTAYRAAKRGARVLLLEQFAVGHVLGSSHGPHRIIRLAYDTADYVVLAKAAFALWRELEQDSGQSLLMNTGGIDFGLPDALELREIAENYAAQGIPYEALDADEIHKRYPQIRPPQGTMGYFQQDYSMLAADLCVTTAAAQAGRFGAVIRDNERVESVRPDGAGVVVKTAKATYRATRAVLCAGSWMQPMLRSLGVDIPLVVTKEQVAFIEASDPQAFTVGRFPLFLHRFPGTTRIGSGFPIWRHSGPKLMMDRIGPVVDPNDPDRSVDQIALAKLVDYATDLLPGLTGRVIESVVCLYTMTPDEDFVVDTHPEHKQIVIASPCSGHGFKFGAVLGDVLTDLALTGATARDVKRFRLDREALKVRA